MKVLVTAVGSCWLTAVVSTAPPTLTPTGPGVPAPAYADGAPAGFSGAFGENACDACHFEADVNSGSGHLALDTPERFVPGSTYPISVSLERAGMTTAGVQLTARFTDGGRQAGTLSIPPQQADRLKIDRKDDIQYVNQRAGGTVPAASGRATWTVLWTAPAEGGSVRFDAAANAGNRDESASGDYVFTASRQATRSE